MRPVSEMTRPAVIFGIVAAIALSCATSNRRNAQTTPAPGENRSTPVFSILVRPVREATFTIGEDFSYWLELKNVSNQAVAVKSAIAVTFSYSQGDLGGGSGNMHWDPCQSETYLVHPGQTLAQLGSAGSESINPGSAILGFAVRVREANSDGTCAEKVHELNATTSVNVVSPKPATADQHRAR
jgi:hypothetical protein